jgi:HK97 gp10 family phage protein
MSKEILEQQLKDLQNTDYSECLIPGVTLIMETSRGNAPVDTGNLRDSHEVQKEGSTVLIVVGAEYAGDVEYGTQYQEAQPFLRPAMDDKADEASQLIAAAMNAKMEEVV